MNWRSDGKVRTDWKYNVCFSTQNSAEIFIEFEIANKLPSHPFFSSCGRKESLNWCFAFYISLKVYGCYV